TRPETMLGDGAVAVHPSDARYAPIVGKMVHLPLCDRLIPIITDEYPDPNFGSGAVKITGAHDFNDYQVAKRSNLPLYRLLDTRGHMRDDGPTYAEAVAQARAIGQGQAASEAEIDTLNLVPEKYRGLDRFTARAELIKDITAAGLAVTLLVKEIDPETGSEHLRLEPVVEAKKIMQPFGDRSKVVIEPMLTDQWFVDTQKVVGPALEAVRSGVTKIIPDSGEKTYFHWLENIEPWCISRQLWWGHQIPVWYDGNGKAYCATSEIEASALANGQPLTRDSDVLDTWFSSGLWPIGTLGWPEDTAELARYFPTTTLITGADIIFFWVARMMMMQLAVVGEVPFKTVYLHGLVRDAKGKKMSKSLGNVIDPIDIIDEFGADALRFANAAMASLGGTLKMDKGRIAGYRNFGTKLWNACRFAEMNGVWEGHITQSAPPKAEATANRWIIAECAALRQSLDDSLDAYRFDDAAHAIYSFVWGKVCDWYVEFAKPMFDTDQADETRKTMAWVLDQSMILLHPIMPFITEELWGTTGRRAKMLVHSDWPTYGSELDDPQARREMNWVTALIDEVRSARAQMHVPAGLKVAMLRHDLDRAALQALGNNQALILRLARLESITQADTSPKGAITVSVEGGRFSIPLAGIIDIGEEKARLNKTIEKLQKELSGLRGRLKNPNFVASAPPEVVEESREKLALGDEEIEKLSKALSRLAEIG
ncbi:MAG: valine--tRNA ligase, partial [Paracoccaceae bacterium]|nr:valine--tRNA ligase [Paracoccaceae bacterium]